MTKMFSIRCPAFSSGNRKSTIENLKWVALVVAFIFVFGGAVVKAQQPSRLFRIGFLDRSTASGSAPVLETFREELSRFGWIPGKNISIDYRFAEEKTDRLPGLAAELVRLKVDLILVTGRAPALAAKKATATIPIVMMSFPDPVSEGLIASLARPGGNVTGNSSLGTELSTKRLEILKDAIPKLSLVGVLQQAGSPAATGDQPKELKAAAQALKLKLEVIETQAGAKNFESSFQTLRQKQAGAIMTGGGRVFFAQRKTIVELTAKYRLPGIYPDKEFVNEGGLMSYGVDFDDLYRRAAVYVDKILKGAKPADLPVQQASKFEFLVNLRAAKQIGLTLSPEFLSRANKVIK